MVLALVGRHLDSDDGDEGAGDEREGEPRRVADALALSASAGVPARELLRAIAADERRRARVEGRRAAARLSSTLLLPLGVCTLPAFVLLGVLPLVFSVLSSSALPLLAGAVRS